MGIYRFGRKFLRAHFIKPLHELADNPDAYEKIKSRVEVVAPKFSIANVASKYIELYEEII